MSKSAGIFSCKSDEYKPNFVNFRYKLGWKSVGEDTRFLVQISAGIIHSRKARREGQSWTLKKHQHFIPLIIRAKPEIKQKAITKCDHHRLPVQFASSKRSFLTQWNLKLSTRPNSKVTSSSSNKESQFFRVTIPTWCVLQIPRTVLGLGCPRTQPKADQLPQLSTCHLGYTARDVTRPRSPTHCSCGQRREGIQ